MSVYEGLGSVQSDLQRLTGFTASLKEHRNKVQHAPARPQSRKTEKTKCMSQASQACGEPLPQVGSSLIRRFVAHVAHALYFLPSRTVNSANGVSGQSAA